MMVVMVMMTTRSRIRWNNRPSQHDERNGSEK